MPHPAQPASTTSVAGTAREAGPLIEVRPARPEDADAIARIHNQGIEDRSATFETLQRRPDQVARRIADVDQPVLVAEHAGEVIGWASVTRENDRCTQAGVGEYTIYVDRASRSVGVGVLLLQRLVAEAERRGYWKLVGRIFTTNESSLALARRCGFYDVGIHRRHGRLGGGWKDVRVVERLIGEATAD